MNRLALALLAPLAACAADLDTAGLPSIDGYEAWPVLQRSGPLAGHGDTVRLIYANPIARAFPHGGRYAEGTALVKEIHERGYGDAPGALEYVAIMRLAGESPDTGADDPGGWIFSVADERGGSEKELDTCWSTCHRQAPYAGAFLDYGE